MDTTLASALALFAAGTWAYATHLIGRLLREWPEGDPPSPLAVNTLRNVVALVGFLVLWLTLAPDQGPDAGKFWLLVFSGALGFAVGDSIFFAALPRCGVQTAAMVGLLNVPIATALAWGWLGQELTASVAAGMLLVLAGVSLVLKDGKSEGGTDPKGGVILSLVAAGCWAFATISGHHGLQEISPFAGAFARLVGAAMGALLCATVLGFRRGSNFGHEMRVLARPFREPSTLRLLVPVILFGSLLNLIPFHFALADLPGAVASLLISTTPLFTLPLAPLFGERFGKRTVLGTMVGFGGVALVVLAA